LHWHALTLQSAGKVDGIDSLKFPLKIFSLLFFQHLPLTNNIQESIKANTG